MKKIDFDKPHRRYNPLIDEWILVSPHRTKRPWQGKVEEGDKEVKPAYDPDCYLCPGNKRAGDKTNPNYESTYSFTNDFAALLPEQDRNIIDDDKLLRSANVNGTCKVLCFSPNHSLTIPEMKVSEISKVVQLWIDELTELGKIYKWVQIFENKGEIMGCSNPHPHGQIWASSYLPNEPYRENICQKKYYDEEKSVLLLDYLAKEKTEKERVIAENDEWVALVPFWAMWPYETILIPKRHVLRLNDLTDSEKDNLAKILKVLTVKYDNIFNTSFPYTMGWHGAPFDEDDNSHWQLHAHFYPPLLRSATVKKFMVGFEMLAEAQRDITPEQAALQLLNVSDVHYKEK